MRVAALFSGGKDSTYAPYVAMQRGGEGIVVGAIASDYQHSRVHRVADELGLRVFAPLWRLEPEALLRDYLAAGMRVLVVGVFAEGLGPEGLRAGGGGGPAGGPPPPSPPA